MPYYIDSDGKKIIFEEPKEIDWTEEELKHLNIDNFANYCEFYELDRLERYSRYLIYSAASRK